MNAPLDHKKLLPADSVALLRARPVLGTLVEISASAADEGLVQAAVEAAFAEVALVQKLMSYHDENSDVSRINRLTLGAEVQVHAHTWRVLRAARLLAEASNGVFDITIAPHLVNLGFLPVQRVGAHKYSAGNWRDVVLLPNNRVRLSRRVNIDLSGIAKGYAVDLAVNALREHGMVAGRVNAGGDLRAFGGAAQCIYVRDPSAHTHIIPLLQLANGAAATSAGYYSERLHLGKMITPLIHPQSGTACASGLSVTVLAKDCMTADALTKVVYANPRGAAAVLQNYKARALIVEHDAASGACHIYDTQQAGTQ